MASDNYIVAGTPVSFVRRRNQKHIRLRVGRNRIVVSAPWGTSAREMQRFCRDNESWIQQTLVKAEKQAKKIENLNRFSENMMLYDGSWVPFTVAEKNQSYISMRYADDRFQFTVPPNHNLKGAQAAALYRKWATPRITGRFTECTRNLSAGLVPTGITIRSQKTRWGSCSTKGSINLNWRLIQCPRFVQDYVFVHELCHLKHMNHSRDFWNLVGKLFPNHKQARTWLKENGHTVFQNP